MVQKVTGNQMVLTMIYDMDCFLVLFSNLNILKVLVKCNKSSITSMISESLFFLGSSSFLEPLRVPFMDTPGSDLKFRFL